MLLNRTLLALLTWCAVSSSNTLSLELPFYIAGETHRLILDENSQYPASDNGSRHYKGYVSGFDNSWVRLSSFNNSWSGITSFNNQMHFIEQHAAPSEQTLSAFPFSSLTSAATCGNDQHNHQIHYSNSSANPSHPALFIAKELAQPFTNQCNNLVDGVCVYADLELVFDQEYQSALSGRDLQGSTDSLMNMVEGYYLNQFNIAFNQINSVFLTNETDIYTSSTDANTVLTDLFSRSCEQRFGATVCRNNFGNYDGRNQTPTNFLKENNSIVHLITGKDFIGSTTGVAFASPSTYCSAFTVGTSQLSRDFGGVISLPFTAATIAHEIGHNFESGHDGDGNSCASTGFVMNAIIGTLPKRFSSCSEEVITQTLSSHFSDSCTTAPIDMTIQSQAFSGSASIGQNLTITNAFTARNTETGFRTSGNIELTLVATGAAFNAVSLAGNACSIQPDSRQATCSFPVTATTAQNIAVTLTPTASNVTVTATDQSNNLFRDADRSNSNAVLNFSASDGGNTFVINADNIALTNNPRPLVRGSTNLNNNGNNIQVINDNTTLCTSPIANDGSWGCIPSENLGEGSNTLTIRDILGIVTRDITAIIDTTTPVLTASNITTSSVRPALSGTTDLTANGGEIRVLMNNTTLCATATISNNRWNCTSTQTLPHGTHTLAARAQDLAGNVSVASFTVAIKAADNNTGGDGDSGNGDNSGNGNASSGGGGGGHFNWFITLLLSVFMIRSRRR
ncbi:M12 family metallo-peptidase [Bacterioplanoides sp.]|uniref:M12 family metallo-peptidase n=1 Tax=Bacterioplanoides sp. TaxID=2066072 RepID=UPI003B5ABAF3